MKPILYYGRPMAREYFEKIGGLRVMWLFFLHRIWCWLGRKIERTVLQVILKRQKIPPPVQRKVLLRFDTEDQGKDRSLASLGIDGIQLKTKSYTEPRKNTPVTTPESAERARTDQALARLAGMRNRNKVYGYPRRSVLVHDAQAVAVPRVPQQEN